MYNNCQRYYFVYLSNMIENFMLFKLIYELLNSAQYFVSYGSFLFMLRTWFFICTVIQPGFHLMGISRGIYIICYITFILAPDCWSLSLRSSKCTRFEFLSSSLQLRLSHFWLLLEFVVHSLKEIHYSRCVDVGLHYLW